MAEAEGRGSRVPGKRLGPPPRPCVFVSYRSKDRAIAEDAADFLTNRGLHVYFDKNDSCLTRAVSAGSDVGIATCLEIALDRSNALLSITTNNTFTSPWPPYEIGSARGREKFASSRFAPSVVTAHLSWLPPLSSPLPRAHAIGHLIAKDVPRVPEFVKLGVPILDEMKLGDWARMLLDEEKARNPGFRMPTAPAASPHVKDLAQQPRAVSSLQFY